MTDFHHNIFYYYRGAQRSDRDYARQLEDNTTKALLNTLENCGRAVAFKFLEWLDIATTGRVTFELQKTTIGEGKIRSKSQRLLLGLVPSKRTGDSGGELGESIIEGESRPDAWLYGDNFVVMLESKVVGSLEPDQMQRHSQKLRVGTERQPRCEIRSWAEVHQFFVRILPELSGKDKWIVQQFAQYLEWSGMTEFTGFEEGIFVFFVTHEDEDTRKWVRDTMQSFAEKILAQLGKFDSFYQGYDLGRLHLKDEGCWVAFGPIEPVPKEYRQWAHQTVSINAYALDVFVNVELKRAIDRLRRKIKRDRGAFRRVVAELPSPFSVQVLERKKRRVSLYDVHDIAGLEADYLKHPELGKHGFDYVDILLEQVHLPNLVVKRRIDRGEALELSRKDQGRSLVDKVVSIMQAFHPLVRFINEPDYTNR
jgi:hypothetical protein